MGLSATLILIRTRTHSHRKERLERYIKNRNLQICSDFMHKLLYSAADLIKEGHERHPQERIPHPFKLYQKTERYSLHQTPPLTLGDPRQTFVGTGSAQGTTTFESLSTLLYYTYGFSRHDEGAGVSQPFHRFVASARCLFPTELYLWLPQTEHIPAGIYHYDNLHHSLAIIRKGQYRDLLAQAVDSDLDGSLGILLISTHFWKTACKYTDFAYRLCTQEAGFVTSNALIVAGTLGYTARVHYQFLDQPLNRLLGFVPNEESLLAIVPLYSGTRVDESYTPPQGSCIPSAPLLLRRFCAKTTQESLSQNITPIALDYVKTTTPDLQLCLLLTEMDQCTFLADTTEIVTETTAPSATCLTTEERIAPPESLSEGRDLAEALHLRSSGDVDFLPLCIPLSQGAFWEIVRYGLKTYNSDLQSPLAPPRLQLYIVIQHVEGMQAGIYRLCADCGMLHVIERGDFSMQVQELQMASNVVTAPANLVCYLVGDYSAESLLFGNRAYRILQMEAGLVAQRICVMSAAQGLTTRYSNSYIQTACKALLKLNATPLEPLAELVIGYEQPGIQAGNRYRFSFLR